jgi:hypothetical protein
LGSVAIYLGLTFGLLSLFLSFPATPVRVGTVAVDYANRNASSNRRMLSATIKYRKQYHAQKLGMKAYRTMFLCFFQQSELQPLADHHTT